MLTRVKSGLQPRIEFASRHVVGIGLQRYLGVSSDERVSKDCLGNSRYRIGRQIRRRATTEEDAGDLRMFHSL